MFHRRSLSLILVLAAAAAAAAACGPRQPPLQNLTAEQLHERGMTAFEARRWEEAIRYLDRFVLVGGADPRIPQARYNIAQARFERREYVTAAADFARLAGDLGRADLADDARFMACRAYEELSPPPQRDQEYTRAAIEHCATLIEVFPASEFAAPAQEIVDRMRARLAEKLYLNGQWYQRRRAPDSALIYYEDVVRLYPATPWAPRALARMIEIYEGLGYAEELQETRERLLQQYPGSPEAREVSGS